MPDGLGETAIRERLLTVKFPILALAQHGRRPFVMIVTVALSLAALVLAASVMAQSQDPLELYDANDDGVIDADEAITAVSDHFAGRIDRAMALRVLNLWLQMRAGLPLVHWNCVENMTQQSMEATTITFPTGTRL